MTKLPKEILLYEVTDRDVKYFQAVRSIDEIPEDVDGAPVGNYVLNNTHTFKVKRELK
jgi:hypothetical protein